MLAAEVADVAVDGVADVQKAHFVAVADAMLGPEPAGGGEGEIGSRQQADLVPRGWRLDGGAGGGSREYQAAGGDHDSAILPSGDSMQSVEYVRATALGVDLRRHAEDFQGSPNEIRRGRILAPRAARGASDFLDP